MGGVGRGRVGVGCGGGGGVTPAPDVPVGWCGVGWGGAAPSSSARPRCSPRMGNVPSSATVLGETEAGAMVLGPEVSDAPLPAPAPSFCTPTALPAAVTVTG